MNFNQPNTILCKPMVTISGQHFLKFEIHNANLTSSFTRQIPALVRVLPLNAILGTIYLKHKLQISKHKLMQANNGQWLSAISQIRNSQFEFNNLLCISYGRFRNWSGPYLSMPFFKIIYLKHKLQQPNTSLCKPIVTNSCQQFLKFEMHNSNLTALLHGRFQHWSGSYLSMPFSKEST